MNYLFLRKISLLALSILIASPAVADDGVYVVQGGPAYFSAGLGAFNAAGVRPSMDNGFNPTLPEMMESSPSAVSPVEEAEKSGRMSQHGVKGSCLCPRGYYWR